MSITCTVEAGKITLSPGLDWPDGTVVRIEQIVLGKKTIGDALKKYDGLATDLLSNLVENRDHSIHGLPKK